MPDGYGKTRFWKIKEGVRELTKEIIRNRLEITIQCWRHQKFLKNIVISHFVGKKTIIYWKLVIIFYKNYTRVHFNTRFITNSVLGKICPNKNCFFFFFFNLATVFVSVRLLAFFLESTLSTAVNNSVSSFGFVRDSGAFVVNRCYQCGECGSRF